MEDQGYTVLGSPASQTVATEDDLAGVRRQQGVRPVQPGQPDDREVQGRQPHVHPGPGAVTGGDDAKAIHCSDAQTGRKGFFFQVEGAQIDKRSHANDAVQALGRTRRSTTPSLSPWPTPAGREHPGHRHRRPRMCRLQHHWEGHIYERGGRVAPGEYRRGNTANNSTPTRPARGVGSVAVPGPINGSGSANPVNFAPATFRTPDDPAGSWTAARCQPLADLPVWEPHRRRRPDLRLWSPAPASRAGRQHRPLRRGRRGTPASPSDHHRTHHPTAAGPAIPTRPGSRLRPEGVIVTTTGTPTDLRHHGHRGNVRGLHRLGVPPPGHPVRDRDGRSPEQLGGAGPATVVAPSGARTQLVATGARDGRTGPSGASDCPPRAGGGRPGGGAVRRPFHAQPPGAAPRPGVWGS